MFVPMGGPDGTPMGPIFPMGSPKPGPSASSEPDHQQKSPGAKKDAAAAPTTTTTPLDLTKSPSEAGMVSPRHSEEISAALLDAANKRGSSGSPLIPPPPPGGIPSPTADAFLKLQQKEIEAQLNMLKARHLELMSKQQQPKMSPNAGAFSSR